MNWSLETLRTRIDSLSLRERAFVMAGGLAVTYFIWSVAVVQPMEARQREVNSNLSKVTAEIAGLSAEAQALMLQVKDDPNTVFRAELDQLRAQLQTLDRELSGTTDHLVPPGQMAKVLEAVLRSASGLKVQELTSLGSSPLVSEPGSRKKETAVPAKGEADAGPVARRVHKHGVRLVLQGSFFTVLEFLRKTEALDWKFFWDAMEFRVLDYPDAEVEITVYTISLEPSWIGA